MLTRTPIAFIVGVFLDITSVYEGGESLIFQPLIASAVTAIVLGGLILLGSPLLVESAWMRWSQLGWYSLLIPALGLLLFECSDLPGLRWWTTIRSWVSCSISQTRLCWRLAGD